MTRFSRINLTVVAAALVLGGCRQGMYDQAKYEPYEGSKFFTDGRSARQPVAGTVAQGSLEPKKYAGKNGNVFVTEYPMPLTKELILRGRERYDIYCSVCHGKTGDGDGMVVQRGFPKPPSMHDERLVKAAPGYFVDVITNGFGVMYPYSDRVSPEDRWAIAAYIRALQRTQNATLRDVPADVRKDLETAP